MKRLITFALSSGEWYAKAKPELSCFTEEGDSEEEFIDWRKDFLNYAAKNGLELKESDYESIASMLDFMIANSPSFSNCIRRADVVLPGGAVLLDSTSTGSQEPLMLFWEEDVVSEDCSNCCKLHRKRCPGTNRSQLVYALNGKSPDCFEKCPEDSCLYGPGLCDRAFEQVPDGFEAEDCL